MSDGSPLPWFRLAMAEGEWRDLAAAFFDLAHDDRTRFEALPRFLKDLPAGRLCARYIETGERKYVDMAGRMLTGTGEWYVYLGR